MHPLVLVCLGVGVGEGLGLGVGLGLGNQVVISMRGCIIWQGCRFQHNTGAHCSLGVGDMTKILYHDMTNFISR